MLPKHWLEMAVGAAKLLGWQLRLLGPSLPPPGERLRMKLTQKTAEGICVYRVLMSPFEHLDPAIPEATCHSYETVCFSLYELGVYCLHCD